MLLSCVAVSNAAEVHVSARWLRTYPGRKCIKPNLHYESQDLIEIFGSRPLKKTRENENIMRRFWIEDLSK